MNKEGLTPSRVRFEVADVTPGTERLPEITVRAALERIARTKIVSGPASSDNVVECGDFHGLIAAAAIAYKQHYPLVLSPDMIWLTILQGVAQHVANHAETLRSRLVSHQTKIELLVDRDKLPETDTEMLSAAGGFLELIEKYALPNKHFLLRTEFSTTTDVERIAGAIVMMDAFSPYFDYVFAIICGIPSVILEGTTADWELLAAKVRTLHESDLEIAWWTRHLLPLCDQFIRASGGDIDRGHWCNLCKLVRRYGVDDLNGWILKFVPYVRREKNEAPNVHNPVLELSEYPAEANDSNKITGCTPAMLPTGMSGVPVACKHLETGETSQYQFVAGFAGVRQAPEDLSVRPIISWAITEGAQIDKLLARLRNEHTVEPPGQTALEDLLRIFERNVPADLWRFYTETDGATLDFRKKGRTGTYCSIYPIREIKPPFDLHSVNRELKYLFKRWILSPDEYNERKDFAHGYCYFHEFAKACDGGKNFIYVFGTDPEIFEPPGNESRGNIFRWSGEPTREAFVPVAHTFAEWLENMLDQKGTEG